MTGPGPEGGARKSSPTSSQPEPEAERMGIAAFCATAFGTKNAAPAQARQARRRCDEACENLDMKAPLSGNVAHLRGGGELRTSRNMHPQQRHQDNARNNHSSPDPNPRR